MNVTLNPLWAIQPQALAELESVAGAYVPTAGGSWWDEVCREMAEERFAPQFDKATGLLLQPVAGVLLRGADPELEAFCGCFNSQRLDAAAALAAQDSRVRGLAILWDSPGGWTQGMSSTVNAFAALAQARPDLPVASLVDGACCSLAYVFANAAGQIFSMSGSIVGSIGIMAVTTDSSGWLKQMGIERRLFTDGKYKGMGTAGIEWKPEWYAQVEARVAALSAQVRSGITARRPGVTVEDMQGQAWEAEEAPACLLDGISPHATAEDTLAAMAAAL